MSIVNILPFTDTLRLINKDYTAIITSAPICIPFPLNPSHMLMKGPQR